MPEKVNHTDVVYIRCPDGTGEGAIEGNAEGIGEGNIDGFTEGAGVGLALGIAVTSCGIRVGAVDGLKVGISLGMTVGEAVGANDIASAPNNWTSFKFTAPEYPPANAETIKASIRFVLESIITSAVFLESY